MPSPATPAASRTDDRVELGGELLGSLPGAPANCNAQVLDVIARWVSGVVAQTVLTTLDEIERRRATAARPERATVGRTAEVLHCDERTVRRLVARGELRGVRLGGGRSRLLIESASVDELLRRRTR